MGRFIGRQHESLEGPSQLLALNIFRADCGDHRRRKQRRYK